ATAVAADDVDRGRLERSQDRCHTPGRASRTQQEHARSPYGDAERVDPRGESRTVRRVPRPSRFLAAERVHRAGSLRLVRRAPNERPRGFLVRRREVEPGESRGGAPTAAACRRERIFSIAIDVRKRTALRIWLMLKDSPPILPRNEVES